ncbi:transcription factor BIM2 isoform X1 [Cucumis melo]|uniref:Transcription factor BIM2 isoform X1 n=1 Tax=Cucumis melo TaxID=3656 RepID=A0A1S4E0P2_CUCME|nr:transcription factor BIM2 isoform X1 [Cucumis melo]XP_050943566.1 transcription factor BIM2 isoform X1 [Cucumis melo]
MVKTSKSIHERFEDDANESGVKIEGKSGESKASGHRSKHSETEQRRRSKINERILVTFSLFCAILCSDGSRFQILRELIPQNDQKRDKASFLLEVIEYIQFLQEKLNMYEGSCRGWSSDPSKLMPWKNYRAADSYTDHSQVVKRGPNHESAIVFSQAMLTNAPNVMDADLCPAALLNAVDHTLVSATQGLPMSMHTQPIVFDPVGRSSLSTESLDEPVSGSENVSSKTQAELLPGRTCTTTGFLNHAVSDQDDLTPESELESISGAYSHGLLSTLTQALQASGVDLSQTNISVKVDVGKRANRSISLSEDDKKQSLNNQLMGQSIHGCFSEESEQTHKKLRTGV